MPKSSRTPLKSTSNLRRSSRLNKVQDIAPSAIEALPLRRRKNLLSSSNDVNPSPVAMMHSPSNPARSQRMTPDELLKWEKALLCKEQECKRLTGELQERMSSLSMKEDETFSMISQIERCQTQAILSQLEDHFTCVLCYEIMAHPYALSPVQCGHTFCAICILTWFFSRLQCECGRWHEAVDCPICRTPLVATPDRIPRLETTFPFVPNRIAAAVCESLIDKLAKLQSDSLDLELASGSGSRKKDSDSVATDKFRENKVPDGADVTAWREGGDMRAEWMKRVRRVYTRSTSKTKSGLLCFGSIRSEGKKEMNHILKLWSTLKSEDFQTLKQKFTSSSHTS